MAGLTFKLEKKTGKAAKKDSQCELKALGQGTLDVEI